MAVGDGKEKAVFGYVEAESRRGWLRRYLTSSQDLGCHKSGDPYLTVRGGGRVAIFTADLMPSRAHQSHGAHAGCIHVHVYSNIYLRNSLG